MNSSRVEQYDYLKHQSTYISDYIKFADSKAGITLSIVGVLFSFFLVDMKTILQQGIIIALQSYPFYLYLISLSVMMLGMVSLGMVIWPRYSINQTLYHS